MPVATHQTTRTVASRILVVDEIFKNDKTVADLYFIFAGYQI